MSSDIKAHIAKARRAGRKTNAAELRRQFFDRVSPGDQWIGLLDLLPDISFFVKNSSGQFVALNEKACEYCGVRSETEAIGRTDFDFFPEQRAASYVADDAKVLASGDSIVNKIESAPAHRGSPRLVSTCKVPIRDASGEVIGVAGFSRETDTIQKAPDTVDRFLPLVAYLHKRFGERISVKQMAAIAGLSTSHFEKSFRKVFGYSPIQYLIRVRIEQACRLLRETNMTVASVALECGFYDHAHFSRNFSRNMGCSPSKYRAGRQLPL